ncbi:MAG: hypothetical protein GOP50_02495 [Candidatus Heimdallarchaeota archaeon]|nr:hypothetical protein [Candidatus Heimdallarchaeota archaeon]
MEDLEKFKQRLIEKENPLEVVEEAMKVLEDFYSFIAKKDKNLSEIDSEDFYDFSEELIKQKRNKSLTYEVLVGYGRFIDNQNLIVWGLEVLDGSEVMVNFSKRLEEEFGKEFRDEIFKDTEIPPLGIDPKKKPDYTKKLITRFESKVDAQTCENFLAKGLRDPYTEWRKPDRERFLNSKDIDEFLEQKRERFIAGLEKHRDEGTLFFTQEVNDEVVEYAKNHPGIEGGIRKGNILTVIKIPHETLAYIHAKDDKMKAYYYCHCPWAKEAILDETIDEIPKVFCNCSGGYYKNYWEIVLDQPIEVKTVKTVISGDSICEFDVYLPEEIVKGLD